LEHEFDALDPLLLENDDREAEEEEKLANITIKEIFGK
jgi:hypothetical protein